jgi:tetratricopeptide (TPR) repeat protein
MKTLLATVALCLNLAAAAQTIPGRLDLALPSHAGHLSLAQGGFAIDELSVKPSGSEFDLRASDGDLHLFARLFVWPGHPQLTAATCRDTMLQSEGATSLAAAKSPAMLKSASGAEIATVLMAPAATPTGLRAFVAAANLCGDVLLSVSRPGAVLPMDKIKATLATLRFDPAAQPTFRDAFAYATVAFDNKDLQGAVHAYRDALSMVDSSDDPLKWRRICTDQLSVAYGMAGALADSIAINIAAIKRDPTYPLYYYNLACAEAEGSNATDAKLHLQQAFERRANLLPGETMPDPASDDSFSTLMQDPDFAAFVQTLNAPKP